LACHHQFSTRYQTCSKIKRLYADYVLGKQTLNELSLKHGLSKRTLQRQFDTLPIEKHFPSINNKLINLVADATFFGRTDGVLVLRAERTNVYWRFIHSETVAEMSHAIDFLKSKGYRLKSVTLDGKRGMINLFKQCFPDIPVQMCQFHQAQIIRRYTTNNPKTDCGKELKAIMHCLTDCEQVVFQSLVSTLQEQYADFLSERNEKGQYKHRQLRSAFRSLKTNMPCLFTYRNYPELNIPNTTNSCDGSFAHWKQKLKIHRGLRKHRRDKMINFLLSHC
jgi:hypothetical protein